MLTRKEVDLWGFDAGEYRDTAQQLAEWLETIISPQSLYGSTNQDYAWAAARKWLGSSDA